MSDRASQLPPPMLSVKELATYLKISRASVYRLMDLGQIKETRVKTGERFYRRFKAEDIEAYLNSVQKEIADDN